MIFILKSTQIIRWCGVEGREGVANVSSGRRCRLSKVFTSSTFLTSSESKMAYTKRGNHWPNIKVRTTWDRKINRAASPNGGTIAVYED
nr:hypothetical protein [Tanacetum cinerariifolium]